jgi:hypothetical protein
MIVLLAQAPADPSGHWEGIVQLPEMNMEIAIDLTHNSDGALAGTYGEPTERLKGFPLSSVTVVGHKVRFVLKAGDQPATFDGTLEADGSTLSGIAAQGDYSAPFTLTRTGEPRIAATPKSAAVGKLFEGSWNAVVSADTRKQRVILTITNQPDGTASGDVFSPDGSGIHVPIALEQDGRTLTVRVPQTGASFVGELNSEGTTLTGTWWQQGLSLAVTFARAAK